MVTVFILPLIDTVAYPITERESVCHDIAHTVPVRKTVLQIQFAVLQQERVIERRAKIFDYGTAFDR